MINCLHGEYGKVRSLWGKYVEREEKEVGKEMRR